MVFSTSVIIISFYQKEIITKSYLQRCIIEKQMSGQKNKSDEIVRFTAFYNLCRLQF